MTSIHRKGVGIFESITGLFYGSLLKNHRTKGGVIMHQIYKAIMVYNDGREVQYGIGTLSGMTQLKNDIDLMERFKPFPERYVRVELLKKYWELQR